MATRPKSNFYYMYGKYPVLEAIKNKKRIIEKVFCLPKIFEEYSETIKSRPYEIVEESILDRKLGKEKNHQGISAYVRSIFSENIEELELKDPESKVALLDKINDPQNIGSIVRSAAAFGINGIILQKDGSPEENAGIAKAAAGYLESVKIIRSVNLKYSLDFLKKEGFWVAGLDGRAKDTLSPGSLKGKTALVLGSEEKGIRDSIREKCDFLLKIPMAPGVESLNVGAAAAIVFYSGFL